MSYALYILSIALPLAAPFLSLLLVFIAYIAKGRADTIETRRDAPLCYALISTLAILSTLSGLLGLLDLKYSFGIAVQTSRTVLVVAMSCSVMYLVSSTVKSEVVSRVALNSYIGSLSTLLLCGTILMFLSSRTGLVAPVLSPLFYLFFSTAALPLIVYIILVQPSSTSSRTPRFVTVIFPNDRQGEIHATDPSTSTMSPRGSCKKSYSLDNIPSPVTITLPSPTHTCTSSRPLRCHSIDFPVRTRTRSSQANEPRTPPSTPTRVRSRTVSTTPPRILFPHQRMPSSPARSVTSTLSLPHTSRKLSFWVYLLVAQISALSSQVFEVCHHALTSSRRSEMNSDMSGSNLNKNDDHKMFGFESVIPEATDSTLAVTRFIANLTLIVAVGCIMNSLLLFTFLTMPTRSRHPHTLTMYAPSNHSHSLQLSPVRPEPRKCASIGKDTMPTVSSSNLIAKSILELAPGHSRSPSPCTSDKTPHVSPWIPGTPQKHYSDKQVNVLEDEEAPGSVVHKQRQREAEERQFSTSSLLSRDRRSATPPTRSTNISVCLGEFPVTPPLTRDDTQTPPSTGGLSRTPPSLANHIRILIERQTTTFTRSTHSRSSSFESPGVASLSMRINPRLFQDNEDEDRYAIPPSPTPATRKNHLIAPIATVDVREGVDVEKDLPPFPRPRTDSLPTPSPRRRQPRRPWTIADRTGIEGGMGSEEGTPGGKTRSTSALSAFFSRSLTGRWSDIFHLGGGGHASHNKSTSQGSLRRADGFERLTEGQEKSRQEFSPLDRWELEALELGLKPTSARSSTATITPPKRTPQKSPVCLDTGLEANSSWLSDPDPFAAPPRGAVTFVSNVKDRGVTRFGVGELKQDLEQSQTPTRMSAWGRLVLPAPSPSPPHAPSVLPLPVAATSENRTGRSMNRFSSKKNLQSVPIPTLVPPLPTPPSTSDSIITVRNYRPGLPRSFSTPNVREETFLPSGSTPRMRNALASTSTGIPSSPHEMPVEEALLAQKLLRKLISDSRRTPSLSGRKRRGRSTGRNARNGEGDSPEIQHRSKSVMGRSRGASFLGGGDKER
ncbi:hypothetical protein L218DRAFT_958604 [Marasmius fiardii PR-910]|nr:hypothetical protein L218DRAFT_958604 [Marasmius fiardii PR-910]